VLKRGLDNGEAVALGDDGVLWRLVVFTDGEPAARRSPHGLRDEQADGEHAGDEPEHLYPRWSTSKAHGQIGQNARMSRLTSTVTTTDTSSDSRRQPGEQP
jgi:hypothetical protein